MYFGTPSIGGKYCHATSTTMASVDARQRHGQFTSPRDLRRTAVRGRRASRLVGHRRAHRFGDELVGVKVLDRHGGLNNVVVEIEFLHGLKPRRIVGAERRRRSCGIHIRHVTAQNDLHLGFLAGLLRHGGNEIADCGGGIGHAIAHRLDHRPDEAADGGRPFLDDLVGGEDGLRHRRKGLFDVEK